MAAKPDRGTNGETVRNRVLIVGLDGATFDVVLPLVEKGRLPVIARLIEGGAWGDLLSTRPPLSPVAWSSFLTGKNPGRHGVFAFEEIVPGTYDFRPVTGRPPGHPTLWRLLGDRGRRVVALDIPFSYPPEPVNGLLVAGYGTPVGSRFTYPQSLQDELARRFGEFDVAVPRIKASPPREAVFRRWDRILENRRRVADYLVRTADWDVFMIVLGVTDHIQHGAWTYFSPVHPDSRSPDAPRLREALFHYYEEADKFIGRLLDAAGEPLNVVILSDHGFGTVWRGDLTRRILAAEGWLRYRGAALGAGVGARVVDFLHRAYDAMPWLKRFLHRRPEDRRRIKRALARAVDWGRTAAFPATMGWQVFVNRRGDFPQGIIEPGEPYERLCREIAERLERETLPGTDLKIIRRVWRRDDLYTGEAAARAPDFFVEYENLHKSSPPAAGAKWDLVSAHAMDGIFIFSGPDAAKKHLEGARIVDVAPTVLYLLGLPLAEDFDGVVLEDAIREDVLRARPIEYGEAPASAAGRGDEGELSPEEAESVRRQLRDLGYLD